MSSRLSKIDQLVEQLKRQQLKSTNETARKTCELFRDLVEQGNTKWADARQLFQNARKLGKRLTEADRMNFTVGNIVKRIYHIIREECASLKLSLKDHTVPLKGVGKDMIRLDSLKAMNLQKRNQSGVFKMGDDDLDKIEEEDIEDFEQASPVHKREPSARVSTLKAVLSTSSLAAQVSMIQKLKDVILTAIEQLIDDIEAVPEMIAEQAKEHIHSNDVILTYGRSNVLLSFFEEAAKGMFFEVVVCETAPSYSGQLTAKTLAEKYGISTTLVPDAAAFAVMSRVDKVIISTHAIMANGGLVTHTGAYMIALAAQAHSVPVYVIGPMYKMTPLYPFDFLTYNELLSPQEIFQLGENDKKENIEVIVPAYDYVPPELVSLYITNVGGQTPKYIYRVFSEFYSQDDMYDLEDGQEENDQVIREEQ